MKAARNLNKGEIISSHEPLVLYPSSFLENPAPRLFGIQFCETCACAIQTSSNREELQLHQLPRFDCDNNGKLLRPLFKKVHCRFCMSSEMYYCSSKCQILGEKRFLGHYLFCPTLTQWQKKNEDANTNAESYSPLKAFFRDSLQEAKKKDGSITEMNALLLTATIFRHSAIAGMIKESNEFLDYETSIKKLKDSTLLYEQDVDEKVLECFALLRTHFYDHEHAASDVSTKEIGTALLEADETSIAKSQQLFAFVKDTIRRKNLFTVAVPHPFSLYIQRKLATLSDSDLSLVLSSLDDFYSNSNAKQAKKDCKNVPLAGKTATSKIMKWRKAAQLIQATTSGLHEDENDTGINNIIPHLTRNYLVFCPSLELQHSCAPNCLVEGSTIPESISKCNKKNPLGTGPVRVSLIALQDINKEDLLLVSKIDDLSGNVEERASLLCEVFGMNFVCHCIRCKCERNWDYRQNFKITTKDRSSSGTNNSKELFFGWRDLKQVADFLMQQGRYKYACGLYDILLKVKEHNGDVLHARCASFLARGQFLKAQQLWMQAQTLCPEHEDISLCAMKQKAYGSLNSNNNVIINKAVLEIKFDIFLNGRCYVTMPCSPVITKDECESAIEWVKETTSLQGWTTSRHYAVPTTDVPLHEIPKVLSWFNKIFLARLRPLLALQFGEAEVGKGGSHIYIHDAFIVKYDADSGQKHLPLHRDESTHSFIIALNSRFEYDGGGTYFAALGSAIRTDIGGMVSFRGDELLHGGDPVVHGKRYVIVAFCYNDLDIKEINSTAPPLKKLKLDNMFQVEKKKQESNKFSFGFQFPK